MVWWKFLYTLLEISPSFHSVVEKFRKTVEIWQCYGQKTKWYIFFGIHCNDKINIKQTLWHMLITAWDVWRLGAVSEALIRLMWCQCCSSGCNTNYMWAAWWLAQRPRCWRSTRSLLPPHHDMRQWRSLSDRLVASRWRHFIVNIALNCHLTLYILLKDGVTTSFVFCLATFIVLLFAPTTNVFPLWDIITVFSLLLAECQTCCRKIYVKWYSKSQPTLPIGTKQHKVT